MHESIFVIPLLLKRKDIQSYFVEKFLLSTVPKVIKLFSCSTQLSTKFILLINVKIPTIVGILTFISMINTYPAHKC